ncbi:MAG: hypothetical protein U1E15_00220 [Hyphomicrobiales bacterium]
MSAPVNAPSVTAASAAPAAGRPKSAVAQPLAFLSLLFGALVVVGFRSAGSSNVTACLAALILAIALPHMLERLPFILSRIAHGNALSLRRIAIKLLGLAALYSVIFLAYLVFRGFTRDYLQPLLALPSSWLAVLAVLVPIYITLTDRVMQEPEDALYKLGCNVLGTAAVENDQELRQFLLGWLVKGFFAPLMIVFASGDLGRILGQDFAASFAEQGGWYNVSYDMLFFVDVAFAATGYLCTLKLFDAQIRSAEPTAFGWLVCIMCYPPFWDSIRNNFFEYDTGQGWGGWLSDYPFFYTLWGASIIALLLFYAWTTVSFGMRFSNLTHRGILTSGPFAFTKHPAYISKNISWWLVSVPFIPVNGIWQAVMNCLALLMINGIYWLRAITEERHLSRDPAYVAYAAWIAEHGVIARLRRLLHLN